MLNYKILVLSPFEIIKNRIKILFNAKFEVIHDSNYFSDLNPIHDTNNKYDLIFLDVDKESEKGLDILKKIKNIYRENPVIFISSSYTTELIDNLKKIENCACIIKPFNNGTVIDKIVNFLGNEAIKIFNDKINKILINLSKYKGMVDEIIDLKVKIAGKKGVPLKNETIAVEISNNPGIEMKTLTTDISGEASLAIELFNAGKVSIISYLESNPSLELAKTISVTQNKELTDLNKKNLEDEVRNAVKEVFIILFTKENEKYKKLFRLINYHTTKGIRSLEKFAEIIAVDDINNLNFTAKNYNPKKSLIITDSIENLGIDNIEILEIKGNEKIDDHEKNILKKLKKLQIL